MKKYDRVNKEKGKIYADDRRKARNSEIEVGDNVLAKRMKKNNKLDADFSTEEFEVIRKVGGDTTVRSKISGKEYRRNVAHLKKIENSQASHEESGSGVEKSHEKRVRIEPAKYKDYVPH